MTSIRDRLQEAVGQRYEIEREVGRGGMATVFLAQDIRHHRPVALKVLHPHLAEALGPERFLREIQIAARLQHPHIVPLYDSGQAGDLLYYVMPFVEGESLRQRLDREGPLPVDDAVTIARGVAAGLDYAHRQQVIHRDIKPENVMLHDGEALVTDFGIAKAVTAAAGDSLTQTGMAVGTPAYMSPEQAGGEVELDSRSDIYSLGAMVYEMLTGDAPFSGPTVQAIMAKLFTEPARPVRETREEVPEWVGEAVQRSLAKRTDERFTTAGEFAEALGWPSGSTPPATPAGSSPSSSIAVLPFLNLSADPDNEYFTDGVAEEIINALTRVQALRVASRTSAFAFKGKNMNISKVGQELNVATVLEGSVRKAGNRLRVTAQLVNVSDGYQLWSERYDRQMDDVFAIQDEIADNIVKALKVVLTEEEKRAIEKQPTENMEAYEYYLRGRQYFHQRRRTGTQFARRMFERAIELDPNYAKAHSGVADCCAFMYMYWDASNANLEAADHASRRALELGPDLAEVHASRGFALSLSKRYDEARHHFEKAIELNPNLFEAHYLYARACVQEGRLEEAVRHYREASRVQPDDYQALLLVQSPLHRLGRHEEAKEALRRGLEVAEKHLELNPDDARAYCLGAQALMQLDEPDRAMDWATRARAIDPTDSGVLYNVACVYALGGVKHQALDTLEEAIQNGYAHREWLDRDTDLDSLRDDPRFEAMRQKL